MSTQSDDFRFLCSEQVKVLYEDESWNTHCTVANLEGISSNSATLLLDERPQPWRPIAFSLKGQDLYGIVESIDVDEVLGCFATIKLDSPYRWRNQSFLPDHFLALGTPTREASIHTIAKSFTLAHR